MNIPQFQKRTRIDNFFKAQAVKLFCLHQEISPNLAIAEDENRYALFYATAQQFGPNFCIIDL